MNILFIKELEYINLPYAAESDEANMKQLGSSVHVSRSDNVDDMGS